MNPREERSIDDMTQAGRDEAVPTLGLSDNSDSGSDSLGPGAPGMGAVQSAEIEANDAQGQKGAFGLSPEDPGPDYKPERRESPDTERETQRSTETEPWPRRTREGEETVDERELLDPVGNPNDDSNIRPDGSPLPR